MGYIGGVPSACASWPQPEGLGSKDRLREPGVSMLASVLPDIAAAAARRICDALRLLSALHRHVLNVVCLEAGVAISSAREGVRRSMLAVV